ncbi:AmmeMemoRadiSam system protein A [candidate division KSB3 bacterium]|jgi:AmmeMemoRadiSam system protein A|uniref:AmmeMemoRadiSam system protein A n=1 Tax=candidate division KSB3 bacterium TaxID=2044937 RepID=A0A9D5Q616_9BACT|nr:AmmeMemoRadiSam system protein A [candidate division KSB3 bacterium]MBD3324943.1 AmmeMemoRadiSam system protein A [candidate division KSB3 bacterium]
MSDQKERDDIVSDTTGLSAALQHKLLHIARETIERYVRSRRIPEFSVEAPELERKVGAFVTIKSHGRLRGCIGHVEGIKPLYETVIEMAIAASTKDPRFTPVTESELDHLEIEISVMSPLRKVDDPSEVQPGEHGLLIKQGFRSGLLLPQVATEQHWDRQTFLEHTCLKAGLPKNAWRDPETDIYVFTAQVFDESPDHD